VKDAAPSGTRPAEGRSIARESTLSSDIEIAQRATLQPITEIASKLGIPPDALDAYGR
jgi:hypothetical protein